MWAKKASLFLQWAFYQFDPLPSSHLGREVEGGAEEVRARRGQNNTLSMMGPALSTLTLKVLYHTTHHLVGLVVRRLPRERNIRSLNPACAWIFSGSSHTSDFKIGTPVATLPGTWRCRVSAGTGRPGVSILWLGEVESLICNFYLSVAAHTIVWADPSLRYTSLLLGH